MVRIPDMTSPVVAPADAGVTGNFTKGMVAASCLSAFQDNSGPLELRRVLRHGLQGGAALAAGAQAAQAIQQRDYGSALASVAAGAVTVMVLEQLLGDAEAPSRER